MANWLTDKAFAHRGLHGPHSGFIENSLSAFDAAVANGYGFELDVLLSSDDKAIVIHDETLERLTDKSGKIIDYTAAQLEDISFRYGDDNIPCLKRVLDVFSARATILIEIKGDQGKYQEIAKAVWKDIKSYQGDLAIMSFYPEIVSYFKNHHPDVVRGLVATDIDDGGLPSNYFNLDQQIKTIKELDVDFIAYDISALPNQATEFCRDHNITVLTWTVRSDADRIRAQKNTDNIIFEL